MKVWIKQQRGDSNWGKKWHKTDLPPGLLSAVILLVLTGALFLSLSCSSTEALLTYSGGPRIFFDQDFVDLGEATPDQKIHTEFRIRNVGDEPLIIYDTTSRALEGC